MHDLRVPRPGRRKFIADVAATGLLLPALLRFQVSAAAVAGSKRSIVETTAGKIEGRTAYGVHVFKGVPYAAPTSGKNRFMAPRKREPWTGLRKAYEYGLSCPQGNVPVGAQAGPAGLIGLFSGLSAFPTGEDCLVLNVWTRAVNDGTKRPVMVWLHGGGFELGAGSSPYFDGTNLCLRGDVVVVTLNHRLNVFGFTHLADVAGEPFAESGNVGMLDIVAALQWVRDNIERFGGDPNTVMVFGQSGGGRKVGALHGMPAARGLFHRAAMQSGPGMRMLERDVAVKATELLLAQLQIRKSKVHELQSLPADVLLRAYQSVSRALPGNFLFPTPSFAPVVDGNVLPQHPFDPVASPLSATVPLLLGSNRTELSLWDLGNEGVRSSNEAALQAAIEKLLTTRSREAIAAYRRSFATASPHDLALLIQTDLYYGVPTKMLAARKVAQRGAPAYVYRFDWGTPVLDGQLHSPHALEVPFVFDNIEIAKEFTGGGAAAAALAAAMSDAWIAFARTGNPAVATLPSWPAYEVERRETMLFKTVSTVVADPDGATRALVESILATAQR